MTKRKKKYNFELVGTVQITTTAERSKRQKWKTFKFWSIEASFQHRKNLLKHDQCKSHQDLFCTIFWPLDRQGWKGKLKERLNSGHLFEYFIQTFRTFRKKKIFSFEYIIQATRELSWERRITRSLTELKHQLHPAHQVKCYSVHSVKC